LPQEAGKKSQNPAEMPATNTKTKKQKHPPLKKTTPKRKKKKPTTAPPGNYQKKTTHKQKNSGTHRLREVSFKIKI